MILKDEPLGNFLDLITYGFTNPMPDSNDGPWKITAKDIVNGKINYSTARKTTKYSFDNDLTPKSKPNIGDILLTKDGTLGRLAIVDNDNICVNQSVAVLRPNSKISSEFLYYLLSSPYYQKKLLGDSDGSVLKHIYVTRVKKMGVKVPKLDTQTKICDIVGNIDKKIRLNDQINKNLENFLKNIFFQWFIKFKEYKGEFKYSELGYIPKNWKVVSLGELVEIIDNRGKTPPFTYDCFDYPIIDVKALSSENRIIDLKNCSKYVSKETYMNWFRSGHPQDFDILISTVGTIAELKLFLGSKGCLAQNVVALRPNKIYSLYLYQYLMHIKKDLEAYNIGSVQPSIKVTHIIKHPVLIPDQNSLKSFNQISLNATKLLYTNYLEIQELIDLRDTLLPKLISGEIKV